MSWTLAALYAVLVFIAGASVLHLYRRREVRVSGVAPLAALRIASLAVVVLLVLDPTIPTAAAGLAGGRRWVLVDGSMSMAAPAGQRSAWARALGAAHAAGSQDAVLVFGDDPRLLDAVDTAGAPPFGGSRLVPALERAAESGARAVRVVSDLRIEDAVEARATAARLGLEVRLEELSGGVRSAGIGSVLFEGPLAGDEPVTGEVTVFAVGAEGDSATMEVREEDRVVASERLALPGDGRTVRLPLELPPPANRGEVRYSARVTLDRDAFPLDDERIAYADVEPEEGNLVLVSLDPDWELRFLLPVLERTTGLAGRGYVAVGTDRYLTLAEDGGSTVEGDLVQRMASGAEILVVQAASPPPPWLDSALVRARKALVLARGEAVLGAVGIAAGPPRPGEWYVSPEVPASPLAGELAGGSLAGLPPLASVLPLAVGVSAASTLDVQLRGTGVAEPAVVLVEREGGRRVGVALASGFWSWAFRNEEGRDAYERLWSGVAGWLLAEEPLARGPGVRPEERVAPVGTPSMWTAAALAGQPLTLRLSRSDTIALDTTLTVPGAGRFRLPPQEAGSYTYHAEMEDGSAAWEGRLDVSEWTADLMHPRDTLMARSLGEARGSGHSPPGRPLRTHPAPYLVVLGLLAAEWIARRRKGLR